MNSYSSDPKDTLAGLRQHVVTGPGAVQNAAQRGTVIAQIYRQERERLLPVLNAAVNTVDAALKRVLVLQETIRAFATRIAPVRAFASVFSNVPLQGTDELAVRYYPLQAAASSDFNPANGYVFDQATTTGKAKITVDKRKYQPLDYSSQEFRRQPYLDVVRLGNINAEKLGADVFQDIWSVITAAKFGVAIKTVAANAIDSDDIIDIRGECTKANWPDQGRALILDSDAENNLHKDASYKLALNIGGTDVIREGRTPRLSGFDVYAVPSLPDNGEKLLGVAVMPAAIGVALAPIDPAPGVRAQLLAYEVVTDAATGLSFNYRAWGDPKGDRDFEVIEVAYGYEVLVAAALKRIETP
jgi:hypothetical protein